MPGRVVDLRSNFLIDADNVGGQGKQILQHYGSSTDSLVHPLARLLLPASEPGTKVMKPFSLQSCARQ